MVTCPVCDGEIDIDEEEVDEGESVSCDECGATLKVLSKDPLDLGAEESADDEDEEDADDDSDDEEEAEEEDEEEEDEWK